MLLIVYKSFIVKFNLQKTQKSRHKLQYFYHYYKNRHIHYKLYVKNLFLLKFMDIFMQIFSKNAVLLNIL